MLWGGSLHKDACRSVTCGCDGKRQPPDGPQQRHSQGGQDVRPPLPYEALHGRQGMHGICARDSFSPVVTSTGSEVPTNRATVFAPDATLL